VNIVKELLRQSKKLSKDLFYTILASFVGNAVLQLIAYPVIAKYFGIDTVGNILFFIGIIYIVPQSIGTALSNTRLLLRKDHETANNDYALPLLGGGAISFIICATTGLLVTKSMAFSAAYAVFSIMYMLKIYAGLEFRLTMNFKGYFIYYFISAVGYLAGLGLCFLTGSWLWIFLIGEGAALLYVFIRGNIFNSDKKLLSIKLVIKNGIPFFWSSFIRDCVTQFDRVIIMKLLNPSTVAQYNSVSIIAKTIQLLVSPLGTLMMTYMTQKSWKLTKKLYDRIVLGCIGFGIVFYILCIAVTPVFIKLFYPTVYDAIIGYSLIINLGLIILFTSSLLIVVLMAQGELRALSVIQTIWGLSYIIIAYFAVSAYGLLGLAYATLIISSVRLVLVLWVSNWKLRRNLET